MNPTLMIEIAQFVGAIAALIIVHEFGHFIVARFFNVEVEEFGLGFPPRIVTLFTAWGTKFSLNWIPLGGFVRPKGENDPNVPGGLAAANPWVRLAVLAAGPLSNLMLGVLLYAFIFTRIGMPVPTQVLVMDVAPGSPAEQAGLRPGDRILWVNEQEINSTQVLERSIRANVERPTTIIYERGGQVEEASLVPRSSPPPGEGAIGIIMGNPTRPINFYSAVPIGAVAVFDQSAAILSFPARILAGDVAPEDGRLVGFRGMFDIYQDIRQGETPPTIPPIVNVLAFFATITISLGLLNMLPIPALDGGRIMFTLPEIILRRRIPPQYENAINLVSFMLLLLFLLYVNIQDFVNPVQLPR